MKDGLMLASHWNAWSSMLVLALLIGTAPSSAADETDINKVELVSVSAHERAAVVLQSGETPVCVFYGRGKLTGQLIENRSRKTWNGVIEHADAAGNRLPYDIRYSLQAPELISIAGRLFRIPVGPTEKTKQELKAPWFVLTSYGRPIATGRYFSRPSTDDLNPKSQYSHAWYFDRDRHAAESQRNTLEMDDLEGWVISWDEQHCIQHSDGARVAKLRIFGDGRVVVNDGYAGSLHTKQIPIEDVRRLLQDLALMTEETHEVTLPGEVSIAGDLDLQIASRFPKTLNNFAMWDQYQDFITVRIGKTSQSINVVHPGPDGNPTHIPSGWDEMRDRLAAIMRSDSQTATTNTNKKNTGPNEVR